MCQIIDVESNIFPKLVAVPHNTLPPHGDVWSGGASRGFPLLLSRNQEVTEAE